MKLQKLYDIADGNDIDVDYFPMRQAVSLSTPDSIAMDVRKIHTTKEETVILAHELGHCMTGSFYQINTFETRDRMEHRAFKWAVQTIIPFQELLKQLKSGMTEPYELAEYFNVTEEFMRKAISFYKDIGKLR